MANFRLVVANLDAFNGIGLSIFYGFNAIDIDDCIANGKMSELAKNIVDTMNSRIGDNLGNVMYKPSSFDNSKHKSLRTYMLQG